MFVDANANFPEPSFKVEKIKGKIVKNFGFLDEEIPKETLNKTANLILDKLSRNPKREYVQLTSVGRPFDNNETTAEISKKTQSCFERIKKENQQLFGNQIQNIGKKLANRIVEVESE